MRTHDIQIIILEAIDSKRRKREENVCVLKIYGNLRTEKEKHGTEWRKVESFQFREREKHKHESIDVEGIPLLPLTLLLSLCCPLCYAYLWDLFPRLDRLLVNKSEEFVSKNRHPLVLEWNIRLFKYYISEEDHFRLRDSNTNSPAIWPTH